MYCWFTYFKCWNIWTCLQVHHLFLIKVETLKVKTPRNLKLLEIWKYHNKLWCFRLYTLFEIKSSQSVVVLSFDILEKTNKYFLLIKSSFESFSISKLGLCAICDCCWCTFCSNSIWILPALNRKFQDRGSKCKVSYGLYEKLFTNRNPLFRG